MSSQDKLSPREIEIAKLLIEGKSNKQIATALNISTRAVEFHLTNIYKKLGVSSRIEAVLMLSNTNLRISEIQ